MTHLSAVPDWLGTAAAGAVVAALGYVSKLIFEGVQNLRRATREVHAHLLRLAALLRASKVAFDVQNDLAKRLSALLLERQKDAEPAFGGYEDQFTRSFDGFTPEEAELHEIIRGITIYAMRPANLAMSKWIEADTTFRTNFRKYPKLAKQLNLLSSHLMLWHAKYQAWIPNNPKHALVYMADEKEHGLGFPASLDEAMTSALRNVLFPRATHFSRSAR